MLWLRAELFPLQEVVVAMDDRTASEKIVMQIVFVRAICAIWFCRVNSAATHHCANNSLRDRYLEHR
jgi:hypothetical protein